MSYAYVSNFNDGTVSVIDTATQTVVKTFGVGGNPFGVALTPNEQLLFVSLYNDGVVRILNVEDISQIRQLGIVKVGDSARGLVVPSNGERAYVAHAQMNGPQVVSGGVSAIDTTTFGIQVTVPGAAPAGLATTVTNPFCLAAYSGASGTRIYVADSGVSWPRDGGLAVLEDAHPEWGPLLPTMPRNLDNNYFYYCAGVAVGSDGYIYVVNSGAFFYWTYGLGGGGSLLGLGPGRLTAAREGRIPLPRPGIPLGQSPAGVVVSGPRVLVSNYTDGNLSVIDAKSLSPVDTSEAVLNGPMGVALAPGQESLYVANYSSNTVTMLNSGTLEVVNTIDVGSGPLFLAMPSA